MSQRWNSDHGGFAPMVGRKAKSLVMRQFVGHSCVGVIHIPSPHLTCVAVLYTFRAVCFGHKLAIGQFGFKKSILCKIIEE